MLSTSWRKPVCLGEKEIFTRETAAVRDGERTGVGLSSFQPSPCLSQLGEPTTKYSLDKWDLFVTCEQESSLIQNAKQLMTWALVIFLPIPSPRNFVSASSQSEQLSGLPRLYALHAAGKLILQPFKDSVLLFFHVLKFVLDIFEHFKYTYFIVPVFPQVQGDEAGWPTSDFRCAVWDLLIIGSFLCAS